MMDLGRAPAHDMTCPECGKRMTYHRMHTSHRPEDGAGDCDESFSSPLPASASSDAPPSDVSYPVHPNKEPPFPETSPCFVCGRERGHDLSKHVDPDLGTDINSAKSEQ